MPKPQVISIAAVSGGGKTTITSELVTKLNNAKALYFDDYDFEECPEDICEWVEKGADYNEWKLSPLIKDIKLLINDKSLNFIVLDYPFAYLNNEMRDFINMAIYIDTPLDIAMARRILRDFNMNPIDNVRNGLTNYLTRGRTAYLEMLRSVKPNSDIVIDGTLPTASIVDRILETVTNKGLKP